MEDNYVVCISNRKPYEDLIIGNRYHVEESFNFDINDKGPENVESVKAMLKAYPNPYFYLEEFHETCSCCGDRIYFPHGLFKTKQQVEDDNLEKRAPITGSQS